MKKFTFNTMASLVIMAVIVSSCAKGDTGPTGPEGPAGAAVFLERFQSGVYPNSNYVAVDDTNINNLSSANYGVCESNWIGSGLGGNVRRVVIRFKSMKSYLPSDAVIVKAYLVVRLDSFNGSGNTLAAHAMTTAFNAQGTSCGSIATDGPNWTTVDGSTLWTTAGGDYNATAAGFVFSYINSSYTFEISAATVQAWLAGLTANYGLMLKMTDEATVDSNCTLYMSDSANVLYRPKLMVYYKLH